MGAARESFQKKKEAEVKVFDVAAQVAELLSQLTKPEQQRVLKMVDEEMKINPAPDYGYWGR